MPSIQILASPELSQRFKDAWRLASVGRPKSTQADFLKDLLDRWEGEEEEQEGSSASREEEKRPAPSSPSKPPDLVASSPGS